MPLRLLAFLTIVNILNYFDRYIVHSVEPILKAEFDISNEQSGLLVSAFVFGYFVFSPLFGYLGDRLDRRWLMTFGLLGWSAATALTGYTTTFVSFFFARTLVGIGEASFGTIVPGYLKGRIPSTVTLNSALSLFYVAIPVGAALGYVLGGEIAHAWSWRQVFQFAAIPGAILAIGFLFIAKEAPVQSTTIEGSTSDRPIDGEGAVVVGERAGFIHGVRSIAKVPVLRLAILGYIFNTFALNGVAAFVVRYGTSLGMEGKEVSKYFGLILLITGFVGTFVGGQLASRIAARTANSVRSLLAFVSISTFIGLPFLCLAFLVPTSQMFLGCCFLAQLALFAGVAPLNSVLVARSPSRLETLTQGVTIFMINLFGSILAPIAIGRMGDYLISRGIDAPTGAPYLAYALQLTSCAMLVSAILWWWASRIETGAITEK